MLEKILKIFVLIAVAAGIGGFVSRVQEDAPRVIPVKPPDKRAVMPAFAFPSTAGHKWSLADHRGKIVLVNFWATWCGPCRQETPDLVRVFDRYRSRGVDFAGIAMDSHAQKVVPPFAERYRISYPILLPTSDSALANAIESLPTTFLLDREGRVARTWVGALQESELTKNIDELLSEPYVPKKPVEGASASATGEVSAVEGS